MTVNTMVGTEVFEKIAMGEVNRDRLGHEGRMLRRAAHPGVVQLLGTDGGDPPAVLRLRRAEGGDLAALGPLTVEALAGLGAALATTVADLHELGLSHGHIEPAHVLLDDGFRPVLCSFGRARTGDGPSDAARRRADVRALAALLMERLPAGAPRRLARVLRTAESGRRTVSARWLARQLVAAVPEACLPGPATELPAQSAPPGGGRRVRRGAVVAVAVGLAAVALSLVFVGRGQRAAAVRPCPAADRGCVSVPLPDGVLTVAGTRYRFSGVRGVVVMGRWDCGPVASPAVLDVATGEVWIFDRWAAPGEGVVGRAVGRLAGARDLRVVPEHPGCDRLEVLRREGAVTLSVGRPA